MQKKTDKIQHSLMIKKKKSLKKLIGRPYLSWVPMAHACNPSYSEGRNQEDQGSKPVQANSSHDAISKIPKT
jgi:hypothetical protein